MVLANEHARDAVVCPLAAQDYQANAQSPWLSDLRANTDALRFHVDMDARLAALADNTADEAQLGDPTDVTL